MLNINKWLKTHALEFINNDNLNINELENLMIHFAREHVEVALKQASINANLYLHNTGWKHSSDIKTVKCHNYDASINKDSILNAYPLENVK